MATSYSTLMVPSNKLVFLNTVPAVEATPDYSTGDLLGGKLTLPNAVEVAGQGGIIRGVALQNAAVAAGANIDAIFFNDDPSGTTFTENGAFAIAAADLSKLIGGVSLSTHIAFNANSLSMPATPPYLPFRLVGSSLYCVLIARATINLAAVDDIKLRVVVERDYG